MKPKHFSSRHIHVEIRYPTDKHLDLNDDYDMRKAMLSLLDEWNTVDEDIRRDLWNIIAIPKQEKEVRRGKLPE